MPLVTSFAIFIGIPLLLQDRDVAVSNAAFDKELLDRFGIKHVYLPIRSKSFAAEVAIRWFRQAAGAAARLAAEQKAPPHIRNSWTRIIPSYLKYLNSKLSKGSRTLRRMDVTNKNFPDLLRERYGTSNLTHLNASLTHNNVGPKMGKSVFKYALGTRVLVSRMATTEIAEKKKNTWFKNSQYGAFGATIYTVKKRALKSSAKLILVPVYQVDKELSRLWLYESELAPLNPSAFSDVATDGSKEEAREEEEEEKEKEGETSATEEGKEERKKKNESQQ